MDRLISRFRISAALLGVIFGFITPALAQKLAIPTGVDCECTLTGPYVDPDTGVDISVNNDGTSPHGKYAVRVSGTGPIDLRVVRLPDSTQLFEQSVQGDTYWGFSPDDDRFVTHYTTGGTDVVTIYDLRFNPAHQVWSISPSTLASRFYFSRHGKYFLYEAITAAYTSYLTIVDAVTGAKSLEDTYIFYNIPDSTDQYGLSVHGFSPDTSDRTFTYAYIYDQNSFNWNVVNLALKRISPSEQHTGISEFWRFSPCGDVLGDVRQITPGSVEVRLLKTVNGAPLGGSSSYPLASVDFKSTSTSQIANVGGTDYVLAPNTAGGVCVTIPDTLMLSQHKVVAGTPVQGELFLNTPAGVGGQTINLSSSLPSAASVPASIVVPEDSLSATFTVTTHAVAVNDTVVISASANGTTKSDTLVVTPQGVASVTLNPATGILGGDSAQCTVYLTNPAKSGGQLVVLTNGNSAISSIPPSITVPQTAMSQTFMIHTTNVARLDSTLITASISPTSASATLLIGPFFTISLQPDTIVGGNPVTLSALSAVPVRYPYQEIDLKSSDSVVAIVNSPFYFPGGYNQYGEPVNTTGVATDTVVSISVTNAPSPTVSSFLVRPANLATCTTSLQSGCLVGSHGPVGQTFLEGYPIIFHMSLDGEAPPGGALIQVTSDHPLILPASPTLLLAYRSSDTSWVLTSNEGLASPQQVIITLSYRTKSVRDTVTIIPRPHYRLIEFGDSTNDTYAALSINNGSRVFALGAQGYYFWENGSVTPVSSYPGFQLYVDHASHIMNDSGHIAGNWNGFPAYWKPDTTILLPLPTGVTGGDAIAINNHDDVIGTTDTAAFLWSGGTMTKLDDYGVKFRSQPYDLNDSRQVVGNVYRDYYGYTPGNAAVLWENGHIVWSLAGIYLPPYGTPVAPSARTINDSGTIAGEYYIQPSYTGHGWFTRIGGDTTNYPSLPPYYGMRPLSINSSGTIVGDMWEDDFESSPVPFLFINGYYYDLNCITDSIPGSQELKFAYSVNNSGIIAGAVRINSMNTTRACLLVPTGVTLAVKNPERRPLPTAYRLMQNYPNPFNPVTMIRYELPKTSDVSLSVYNLLGQEVATLVHQRQTAGYYSIQFGNSGLGSGVYFYRLTAGQYVSVKKMMLVK